MKTTQWIVFSFALIASKAFCIEWDARKFDLSAGVGFGAVNQENFNVSPVFSVTAGGQVPLLVEQHLRAATTISLAYAPIYAKVAGDIGGNYSSLNLNFYLEHDLSLGTKKAWIGLGLQAAVGTNFGQFKLLESGYSDILEDSLHGIFGFASRIEIPITSAYSASLLGQYSPMESALNSVNIGFTMSF